MSALLTTTLGTLAGVSLLAAEPAAEPASGDGYDEVVTVSEDVDDSDIRTATPQEEHGPFFEAEPASDSVFRTKSRKTKYPVLSVGQGAFCFVEGSHCRSSLLMDAGVGFGMRLPASDQGPDMPYAMFTFRGGLSMRPLMLSRRRDWHAWGLGVVGSWSRGTGAVTVMGDFENQEVEETPRTDSARVAVVNQLWLSKKPYALHLDFTMGAVNSEILTSGTALWGTHAEFAVGWGGWATLFASGDFLDRDTRVVFGFRGHGIAAGPIIAMALVGLAAGGAL